MSGREVKEYTNLSDPKGAAFLIEFGFCCAGLDFISKDFSIELCLTFLDDADKKSGKGDDEDATFQRMVAKMQDVAGERGGYLHGRGAATQADSSPASVPLPLRVEPKPKSGIRQQDLLRKVVEVKPKRPKVSTPSSASLSPPKRSDIGPTEAKVQRDTVLKKLDRPEEQPGGKAAEGNGQGQNALKGLLGLAYESSDEDE
ncbi:Uncharacterized protein HA466_0093690 [Hirschfeldia incana]|nr:Uncharacterized protein HA466_0093690 [Hirschfeldia incana]